MIFLWAFSSEIEDAMGLWRFFILYNLVTMLFRIAAGPHSTVPNLGVSGAIVVWLFHSGCAHSTTTTTTTTRFIRANPAVSGSKPRGVRSWSRNRHCDGLWPHLDFAICCSSASRVTDPCLLLITIADPDCEAGFSSLEGQVLP